jgi:Ca2+:H+ antiporter
MSIGIYSIFLAVQTSRYRNFFVSPDQTDAPENEKYDPDLHGEHEVRSSPYHGVLLVFYILPLVLLAKEFAVPLEYGIAKVNAPNVLSGFIVALLILAPEAMSAVKAALRNQLQRSVNILLGSVLATIGLTVPAVLIIGLITGKTVYLGLSSVNSILLVLLLGLSTITFSNVRTNALLGAVHMLLFFAFIMLMFQA